MSPAALANNRFAPPTLAILLGLVVWEIVSIGSGRWLPGLTAIAEGVVEVGGSDTLAADFLTTLRRIAIVWIASVVVGVAIGVAAGFSWWFRAMIRPVLAVALAIPDLVYIIMVILILGTAESSGLISIVLAIVPLVVNISMNAVMDRDQRLDEMSRAYRFSKFDYVRNVLGWQIRPSVRASAVTAFAFSWKLIVLLEAVTSSTGVGARIMEEFRFLRPAEMLAYALLFTIIMKVIEVGVIERLFGERTLKTSAPKEVRTPVPANA